MMEFVLFVLGCAAGATGVLLFVIHRVRQFKAQQAEIAAARTRADASMRELKEREQQLQTRQAELDRREVKTISFEELRDENTTLKRDLQNIDVTLRKLRLDAQQQSRRQAELDARAEELGGRYLKDQVAWISRSLNPNNYANAKQRLVDAVTRCRGIGLPIPQTQEQELIDNLKQEYERVVRAAFEREEQARIKAQIREEQRLAREIEREREQAERETAAIQAAIARALADKQVDHTAELEQLKAKLAEAQARSERAMSQAQLTKAGHVYVISNIGSFGEGVFKIGMTRRLEPLDRIRELGDASVPFPFDVHMMVSCEDAPTLENALHHALHRSRVNKVNPRKEFFRSDVQAIRQIVEQHHGKVEYIADAEALEYRQSLEISDEDLEFVESVYDEIEEESEGVAVED